MKNLFSKKPSDELILKALRSLGFENLQDPRRVEEGHLVIHLMEEVKDELATCYYPVFYNTYIQRDDFDYKQYITVVRQLLRLKGRQLLRKEKCKLVGDKTYKYVPIYCLDLPPSEQVSGAVELETGLVSSA
jgi:hypothetical protein